MPHSEIKLNVFYLRLLQAIPSNRVHEFRLCCSNANGKRKKMKTKKHKIHIHMHIELSAIAIISKIDNLFIML